MDVIIYDYFVLKINYVNLFVLWMIVMVVFG